MTKKHYYILAKLIAGEKMADRMLAQWDNREWNEGEAAMEIHELKQDYEYIQRLGRD